MEMLEFFVTVGAVTALIGMVGISTSLLFGRNAKLKKEQLLFSLIFFLFSSLGVAINGFLIGFELAYKNWEAFDTPSVLLTYHFFLFATAFVLNCISVCLHFVKFIKTFFKR